MDKIGVHAEFELGSSGSLAAGAGHPAIEEKQMKRQLLVCTGLAVSLTTWGNVGIRAQAAQSDYR